VDSTYQPTRLQYFSQYLFLVHEIVYDMDVLFVVSGSGVIFVAVVFGMIVVFVIVVFVVLIVIVVFVIVVFVIVVFVIVVFVIVVFLVVGATGVTAITVADNLELH